MNPTDSAAPEQSAEPDRPCGLLRRGLIILYDLLPATAIVFIAALIALPLTGDQVRLGRDPLFTVYVLGAWFVYLGLCWTLAGQTLGMRAWKVEIVTAVGQRPGWGRCLGRFLAAGLSLAPLGLGFLLAVLRRDRACWHDRLSGTRLRRLS